MLRKPWYDAIDLQGGYVLAPMADVTQERREWLAASCGSWASPEDERPTTGLRPLSVDSVQAAQQLPFLAWPGGQKWPRWWWPSSRYGYST